LEKLNSSQSGERGILCTGIKKRNERGARFEGQTVQEKNKGLRTGAFTDSKERDNAKICCEEMVKGDF